MLLLKAGFVPCRMLLTGAVVMEYGELVSRGAGAVCASICWPSLKPSPSPIFSLSPMSGASLWKVKVSFAALAGQNEDTAHMRYLNEEISNTLYISVH